MNKKRLMLGNEAIARGAYEAGVTVAVAYPGTPSTEITEYISEYEEIYAEWAPNEKVALEVGIGSSLGGARTIVAMKHVGLNVAADPLFTLSYTGVNGGLVIVVADDPGMHSSQNEQDSRYYARAAHIPMLEPADSREAKEYVKYGLAMSEKYDTPVIVRLTTRIAHSQSILEISERKEVPIKDYQKDITKYVMIPSMARNRHVVVEKRMKKILNYASESPINSMEIIDTKIGVITSGISYQYVKDTMPEASVLKLGLVHPLPRRLIEDFAKKVENLYVVEELEAIIEEQIQSWGVKVSGKELLTLQGEYSINMLTEKLLGKQLNLKEAKMLPGRTPVMCAGCPHRGVFYTLNKLRKYATGDIGCYALGALPPFNGMDTCIDMGASVSMIHGIEKARGKEYIKNWVGVIGDSTFVHSGITGLVNIIHNKGVSTIIILDNSTTAMTGHQDNPATGITLKGEKTKLLNLVDLCKSIGVERVRIVNPFKLREVEKAVKEETEISEPSVIIAKAPCKLLDKKIERTSYIVEAEICKTCDMCMKLGCPAIHKQNGKIMIEESQCTSCGLCAEICKVGAIRKEIQI